ncbi:MAG: tetratricopeptide repeat protein [Thiobacillus sp.]|nr:tetratricopeptide repeat protein [Thiobacillus sp.]
MKTKKRKASKKVEDLIGYALNNHQNFFGKAVIMDDGRIEVITMLDTYSMFFETAVHLLNEGQLEDGLRFLGYLESMSDSPDPRVLYNKGICQTEMGLYHEAIESLKLCVSLEPDHSSAWTGLGVAYSRLGLIDEFAAASRSALDIHPDNPYAHTNLGLWFEYQGEDLEALNHFRSAMRSLPGDFGLALNLAKCCMRLGNRYYDEAESVLTAIIMQNPKTSIKRDAMELLDRLKTKK